jgi:hypothetical protein
MQVVRVTAFVRVGFDALIPDELDLIEDKEEIADILFENYFNDTVLKTAMFNREVDWWEWIVDPA